jgi:hypothetical protein
MARAEWWHIKQDGDCYEIVHDGPGHVRGTGIALVVAYRSQAELICNLLNDGVIDVRLDNQNGYAQVRGDYLPGRADDRGLQSIGQAQEPLSEGDEEAAGNLP